MKQRRMNYAYASNPRRLDDEALSACNGLAQSVFFGHCDRIADRIAGRIKRAVLRCVRDRRRQRGASV